MKKILSRIVQKTPPFFNRVKIVGAALVAVSVSVATAGAAVPAVIASYAGIVGAIGGTMVAVGQLATPTEK